MHQKKENQQALTIRNLLIFFPFVYFCFPFNCFDPKLFMMLIIFIFNRQAHTELYAAYDEASCLMRAGFYRRKGNTFL